jgi:hypothetical protein
MLRRTPAQATALIRPFPVCTAILAVAAPLAVRNGSSGLRADALSWRTARSGFILVTSTMPGISGGMVTQCRIRLLRLRRVGQRPGN